MLEDRPKGRFNSPGEVLRHRVACEGTNASARIRRNPWRARIFTSVKIAQS